MGHRQHSEGNPHDIHSSSGKRRKVAPMEKVRVCRSCGHIDPVDSRGRCPSCGVFFELAIMPRTDAEQLARQRRRRVLRRRLMRLAVALAVVGGTTIWALGHILILVPAHLVPQPASAPASGLIPGPRSGVPQNIAALPPRQRHSHIMWPGPIALPSLFSRRLQSWTPMSILQQGTAAPLL